MDERTHIDLFTGLAGFSLAARANGVRTIAMCEADSKCQAFLAQAWPGVPVWPDVRTFSLAESCQERVCSGAREHVAEARKGAPKASERERIRADFRDASCGQRGVWLLTAGVPCQPASRAGKQRGSSDDRWLWPAALSVFAAVRPAWAIFENPPGIGDVGLAGILSDVEAQGYAVRVFSLGACALGAPHRRMRYWIVCKRGVGLADSKKQGQQGYRRRGVDNAQEGRKEPNGPDRPCTEVGKLAHTECCNGGPHRKTEPNGCESAGTQYANGGLCAESWSNYVWLPCADGKIRRAPDDSFRLVDGLHRSVLGALGNSIVPQIATQIIAAMIASENQTPPLTP